MFTYYVDAPDDWDGLRDTVRDSIELKESVKKQLLIEINDVAQLPIDFNKSGYKVQLNNDNQLTVTKSEFCETGDKDETLNLIRAALVLLLMMALTWFFGRCLFDSILTIP